MSKTDLVSILQQRGDLPSSNVNDQNALTEQNELLRRVLEAQAERIHALEAEQARGPVSPPHGLSVPLPPLMQDPRVFAAGQYPGHYYPPVMPPAMPPGGGYQHTSVVVEAPRRWSIHEVFERILIIGGFTFVAIAISACVIRDAWKEMHQPATVPTVQQSTTR